MFFAFIGDWTRDPNESHIEEYVWRPLQLPRQPGRWLWNNPRRIPLRATQVSTMVILMVTLLGEDRVYEMICIWSDEWREIFMNSSVNKCTWINFWILCVWSSALSTLPCVIPEHVCTAYVCEMCLRSLHWLQWLYLETLWLLWSATEQQ